MDSTPPPGDKRPRGAKKPQPPTDPDPSGVPPEGGPLGELAGYDSQGTDLFPMPEGALDDLPPPSAASAAAASWLGQEELARDESDVIRGLSHEPPPAGSSNIFDTGPGGSSRFSTQTGSTESITGEQPRPSNDVLYADLAQPAEPSSVLFGDDDLFARPDVRAALRPAGDSDPGRSAGGSSGGGPNFDATEAGDDSSNLFADPTAADLDLDDDGGDSVPLGTDPHLDADLARTGPGSSIFAGGVTPQGSALDVDHIPIMASVDEGRYEELPFDAPPPSGVGADIFSGVNRPLRPSGIGAVAFDLPHGAAGIDPDATERSDGGVDWDIPDSPPSDNPFSQKSRRLTADEADAIEPAVLAGSAAGLPAMRQRLAEKTGRASLPDLAPARRGGRLAFASGGLLTGIGATAAAVYLGGFLATDAPVPKPPAAVAVSPSGPTADFAELERIRNEADADRKRLTDQVAAAGRKSAALQAELDKAGRPDPELAATQKKLLDALAAADTAKKDAASAAGKLEGTTKALAEATAKRRTADEAVAGVVGAMKANKLADAADDAAAVLAKLPAALKVATSADAQKAAAVVAEANAKTDAVRAELAVAKKATEAATTAATAATTALAAAQAKADERVKLAAAEATAKAGQELEAARGREAALRQQVVQAQQAADGVRVKLEEGFARQLADARGGVVVPLSSAELRAKDLAAAELGRGMTAFFAGRTADAVGALDTAAARNPADARAWYFLGLAKRRAGDGLGADAAFRQGADLERKGRSARREVNEALLNVQGIERTVLAAYRP